MASPERSVQDVHPDWLPLQQCLIALGTGRREQVPLQWDGGCARLSIVNYARLDTWSSSMSLGATRRAARLNYLQRFISSLCKSTWSEAPESTLDWKPSSSSSVFDAASVPCIPQHSPIHHSSRTGSIKSANITYTHLT